MTANMEGNPVSVYFAEAPKQMACLKADEKWYPIDA